MTLFSLSTAAINARALAFQVQQSEYLTLFTADKGMRSYSTLAEERTRDAFPMEDARSPPPTRPIFSAFAPPPCNHAACREARQAWILLARCDPEVPQALAKTTAELHDTLQDVAMDTYDHEAQKQLVVGFPHHPEPLEILGRSVVFSIRASDQTSSSD